MSARRASFPSGGIPSESAEEFMALLLQARDDTHDCEYCRYFKTLGNEILARRKVKG